jgi:hypothetical protein
MNIFIPTCGRVESQTTWDHLAPELRNITWLVCPKEELEGHENKSRSVIVCPVEGIGPKRDYILSMAQANGFDHVLMLDDDIVLQRRRKDGKITNSDDRDQMDAVAWLDACLENGFLHAALSIRSLGFMDPHEYVSPGRAQGAALACNVPAIMTAGVSFCKGFEDFEGHNTMEDFNLTLQLLRMGFPNVVSFEHKITPKSTNVAGGCSSWRTPELVNASAERLVSLFPGIVKLRTKKAWEGMGSKEINDVTVQWKRALNP